MDKTKELTLALGNAAAMIGAIYEWVDKVQAQGGATSISGIAACNAMLKSLEKNRSRTKTLILEPAQKALGNLAVL